MDHLLRNRKKPKTINCHFSCIHTFYDYLIDDEGMALTNPVRKNYRLRLARPLPKHLRDEQVAALFNKIADTRDRAMFMLMLRCGLRVEEVARLTVDAIEYRNRQLYVFNGKGSKDRVVYLSEDALSALESYVKKRKWSTEKKVFLVQKGPQRGKPISVRGIQKRIEHYAHRAGIHVSCHHLRHTMATQLLNADAALVTIQDLLGHSRITTTQCYCRISNLKVQRDYFKAIKVVLERTQPIRDDISEMDLRDDNFRDTQHMRYAEIIDPGAADEADFPGSALKDAQRRKRPDDESKEDMQCDIQAAGRRGPSKRLGDKRVVEQAL
jgi:site-specific recombinase XerD